MLERESGYFLRAFIGDYLKISVQAESLSREFHKLAGLARKAPDHFLLHRDFQSRNILMPGGECPHVIDFQGARWGPLQYDVAALVIDPYVPLTEEVRLGILAAYVKRLDASGAMDPELFLAHYPVIALHRNLQILGAFAYLGHGKAKPFFLQWIPTALTNLAAILRSHPEWDCPVLERLVERAMPMVTDQSR
jgi:aminoglycoside/choline kinase family phosphotransferase